MKNHLDKFSDVKSKKIIIEILENITREKSNEAYFCLPNCKNFFESLPSKKEDIPIKNDEKISSSKEYAFTPSPHYVNK